MNPEHSDRVGPSRQLAIVIPSLPLPSARVMCGPLSLLKFMRCWGSDLQSFTCLFSKCLCPLSQLSNPLSILKMTWSLVLSIDLTTLL